MNRQIRLLGAGLIVLFLALFLNLNWLQLVHAKALDNNPLNSTRVVNEYDQPRGAILSADGVTLADSVPAPKGSSFKYERKYPTGSLFGHITGWYSYIYGSSGVESTYNDILTGATNKSGIPTSLSGLRQLLTARSAAQNITLTLSDKLQRLARRQLAGRNGSVVALDPATGAILAMYSNPSYNPAALSQLSTTKEQAAWKHLLHAPGNPLLAGSFGNRWPPGSSFKVVTASAVYDRKPSLANKSYPYLGALPLPQTTTQLHNFAGEVCGGQLLLLFQRSCDTGFGRIGLDLGAKNLYDEARAFGFDTAPPIDLPNPAVSNFPAPSTFTQNLPTLAYSAIGQEDVAASPLQMAMVAGAIANHGVMMVPHVLSFITNSQGTVVSRYEARAWRRATSAATARKVTVLMESVVKPGGTAPSAAIPGVVVAGKTGTAQTGTTVPRTDDWFVAFAPAAHPTIAVAVVLPDQPSGTEYQGGTLAAPIARAMIQSWLAAHPVKGADVTVHADTGGGRGSASTPATSAAPPPSTTSTPAPTSAVTVPATAPPTTPPTAPPTTPAPATTAPATPSTTSGKKT